MIAAIVTAYKPDAAFASRFTPLLEVCGRIVVVDNTPGGHSSFDLPDGFVLLQSRRNTGLARALNAGVAAARGAGAASVVLFDQDSTPTPRLVSDLQAALAEATARHGPRCCIGPLHLDDAEAAVGRQSYGPAVARPASRELSPVTCLPTSGMVFNLEALAAEDAFAEDLFLDLVDFEWCWRLATRGWTFYRAADVTMFHRLGISQERFLGLTYHVPAPYRHYFQVRDTLRLAARRYVPMYSKLRLVGVLPLKAVVYPLILDHGIERLRWMWLGLLDALRGVAGVGAAARRLGAS